MDIVTTKEGVLVTGPVTNIVLATAANAAVVFQASNWIPPGGQQVGTKSYRLVKITIKNNAAGPLDVNIGNGVGVAFISLAGPYFSANGMDRQVPEIEIPMLETFADITAWPTVLLAGGSIDVQVELLERG